MQPDVEDFRHLLSFLVSRMVVSCIIPFASGRVRNVVSCSHLSNLVIVE